MKTCPRCGAEQIPGKSENTALYKCRSWFAENDCFQSSACAAREREAIVNENAKLRARVRQLERAMRHVVPVCEYLHHGKRYQGHRPGDCPVERLILEAKEGKR